MQYLTKVYIKDANQAIHNTEDKLKIQVYFESSCGSDSTGSISAALRISSHSISTPPLLL